MKIVSVFQNCDCPIIVARVIEGLISITKHPGHGGLCVSEPMATRTFTHCLSVNAVAYWGHEAELWYEGVWGGGAAVMTWYCW